MTATQRDLVQLGKDYLYPNYRQPEMVLARGHGLEVWDVAGKRYLDFTAGIAVNALGHAHPRWVEAVSRQAATLSHVSNYFFNEPNVRLAAELCRRTAMARAFFCNSGAEAIEACLKLARRSFFERGQAARHRVIAFRKSFHGRTMGALAATGQAAYRDGFGPLAPVTHVDFGEVEHVRSALSDDTAAILVEPIQGEGGVIPAPDGFLAALRRLADEAGVFLILDEIQTGVGRTGRFLACEHASVKPDLLALAKGLGGGFPIGAMLCREGLESVLPPGSHGSTFGGNPLASAAALAVLEALDAEGLLDHCRAMEEVLVSGLQELCARHPKHLAGVRGRGLLQGLILRDEAQARTLMGTLRDQGLLVTLAGGTTLRFSPPLVVRSEHVREALGIVDSALGALA